MPKTHRHSYPFQSTPSVLYRSFCRSSFVVIVETNSIPPFLPVWKSPRNGSTSASTLRGFARPATSHQSGVDMVQCTKVLASRSEVGSVVVSRESKVELFKNVLLFYHGITPPQALTAKTHRFSKNRTGWHVGHPPSSTLKTPPPRTECETLQQAVVHICPPTTKQPQPSPRG